VFFDGFEKLFFRPTVVIEISQSPPGILFAVQEGGDKHCVGCGSGKRDHHQPQGEGQKGFVRMFPEHLLGLRDRDLTIRLPRARKSRAARNRPSLGKRTRKSAPWVIMA